MDRTHRRRQRSCQPHQHIIMWSGSTTTQCVHELTLCLDHVDLMNMYTRVGFGASLVNALSIYTSAIKVTHYNYSYRPICSPACMVTYMYTYTRVYAQENISRQNIGLTFWKPFQSESSQSQSQISF